MRTPRRGPEPPSGTAHTAHTAHGDAVRGLAGTAARLPPWRPHGRDGGPEAAKPRTAFGSSAAATGPAGPADR
ncbi:hypothetical protein ACSR0Z_24900 [Streptomyces viridosporus]